MNPKVDLMVDGSGITAGNAVQWHGGGAVITSQVVSGEATIRIETSFDGLTWFIVALADSQSIPSSGKGIRRVYLPPLFVRARVVDGSSPSGIYVSLYPFDDLSNLEDYGGL